MRTFDTLLEALNDLNARGFTLDFKLNHDCMEYGSSGQPDPTAFEITEVYRFEGMTSPDDSAVLYAIEGKNGMKGVLIDAYGAYASSLSAKMLDKLKVAH